MEGHVTVARIYRKAKKKKKFPMDPSFLHSQHTIAIAPHVPSRLAFWHVQLEKTDDGSHLKLPAS